MRTSLFSRLLELPICLEKNTPFKERILVTSKIGPHNLQKNRFKDFLRTCNIASSFPLNIDVF